MSWSVLVWVIVCVVDSVTLLAMLMHRGQVRFRAGTRKEERRSSKERARSLYGARVWICVCVCVTHTFVDVECDGADCDADHTLWVVEKLNGFGVQGKVISVLCVGDREGAPVSRAQHCATEATQPQRERERAATGDRPAGEN